MSQKALSNWSLQLLWLCLESRVGEGRRTVSTVIRSFVPHFRNCSQCHRKGHQQPSANPGSGLSLCPPAVPLRTGWDRGKGVWTKGQVLPWPLPGSASGHRAQVLPPAPSCHYWEILARELVPTTALPAARSPGPLSTPTKGSVLVQSVSLPCSSPLGPWLQSFPSACWAHLSNPMSPTRASGPLPSHHSLGTLPPILPVLRALC